MAEAELTIMEVMMHGASFIKRYKYILASLLLLLVPTILCFIINLNSSSFKTYNIGKTKILALRNIDDAYPIYASTFKMGLDLALNNKANLRKISGGGIYEQGVEKLYENLDRVNADVRTSVGAAYSKYVTSLSVAQTESERANAAESFDKALSQITQLAAEIRRLNVQMAAVQTQSSATEWDKLFRQGEAVKEQARRLDAQT